MTSARAQKRAPRAVPLPVGSCFGEVKLVSSPNATRKYSRRRIASSQSIPTHTQNMAEQQNPPIALVTGAGLRLGRAIALDLAKRGWRIGVHHRTSSAEADALVAEIERARIEGRGASSRSHPRGSAPLPRASLRRAARAAHLPHQQRRAVRMGRRSTRSTGPAGRPSSTSISARPSSSPRPSPRRCRRTRQAA